MWSKLADYKPNTESKNLKLKTIFISESVYQKIKDEAVANFLLTLNELPPTLRRKIGRIIEISNIRKLVQSIKMGEVISCVDASLGSRGRACHATIVESTCKQYRVACIASVDCNGRDLESTRAEFWGEVLVCGDNKDSLVQTPLGTTKMSFPRFFRPNVDLKIELQHLRELCPKKIELVPTHIKGHQDKDEQFKYERAPHATKRNIDIEKLAKRSLQTHQGQPEPKRLQLKLSTQKASLIIADARIFNNIQEQISLHFSGTNFTIDSNASHL